MDSRIKTLEGQEKRDGEREQMEDLLTNENYAD